MLEFNEWEEKANHDGHTHKPAFEYIEITSTLSNIFVNI